MGYQVAVPCIALLTIGAAFDISFIFRLVNYLVKLIWHNLPQRFYLVIVDVSSIQNDFKLVKVKVQDRNI